MMKSNLPRIIIVLVFVKRSRCSGACGGTARGGSARAGVGSERVLAVEARTAVVQLLSALIDIWG